MICKNCGTKNADSRTKCFNCGQLLNDFNAESNYKNTVEDKIKEYVISSDSEESYYDDEKTSRYDFSLINKANNNANTGSNYEEKSFIEEISIDDGETERYFSRRKPKKNNKFGFNVAIWLLSLVFILVAVYLGITIKNAVVSGNSQNTVTNSELEKINVQTPTITKNTDSSGTEYLHCIFYGTIGDRVYLACNDSYHTFVEETTEFDLYLEDLFPSSQVFTDSIANANLNASIVRGNKKYSCGTQTFSIAVPAAQYKIISPDSKSGKSYAESYTLRLWALPDSVVTLNGKNISSEMDGTGLIEHEIETEENSSTTYNLQITQPYHTPVTDAFIISRDSSPVKLTVSTNSAKTVSESTVTVKGSTEQGVTITSDMTVASLKQNTLYNTYELTFDLSTVQYGLVEAKIYATNEKGTTTNSYSFWYWPSEESITSSAVALSEKVLNSISEYSDKNILISEGKIEKILDANKYLISASIGGAEQQFIIKNDYNRGNVKLDSTYKIYASYDGTNDGSTPILNAWYII